MRPIPGGIPCLPCMKTLYHGGYECTTSITGTCRRCLSDCSAIPQPLAEEAACLSLFAWVCLEKNKYPANYRSLRLAVDDFCARVEEWKARHPLSSSTPIPDTGAVDLLAGDELASFFVERPESLPVKKRETGRIMVHEDKSGQRLPNSAVVRHTSSIRPAVAPTVELSLRDEKRGRDCYQDENSIPLVKMGGDDTTLVGTEQCNMPPVCKKRCSALNHYACIENVSGIDASISPCAKADCIIQDQYGKPYTRAPVCALCNEVLENGRPSCSECVDGVVHHDCACDRPPDWCGTCGSSDVNEDWSCNQCIADVVGHFREQQVGVSSMSGGMGSGLTT